VHLQLASTAGRLTGQDVLPLLHHLMEHSGDGRDPCIPLMIWLAYQPRLVAHSAVALDWLKRHAAGNLLLTEEIVPRVLRRLVALDKPEALAACIALLGEIDDSAVRRRALQGMMQALEYRQTEQPAGWKSVFASLLRDPDAQVQRLARRLAVKLHDRQELERCLALALDRRRPLGEREDAVRDLSAAHPPEALRPLEELLARDPNPDLRCEVCRTLSAYDDPQVPQAVLGGWKSYPPAVRVEAVNLLAGRKEWADQLLAAVGRNEVPRTDLTDNTILRIRALRDAGLNRQIESVWGKVREKTPAEVNALIDRMRAALGAGRGSFERGRKVFENQCSKCHRFEGKGHDVGPNLDGAGRDIEYLLVNILDPNRVVGQPYYTRFVALKNGRVETGLLASEDERSLTLKNENDSLKVILKKDIEELTVQEKSLMPEGLNKNMSEQDLRDLVSYVMANPFLTEVSVADLISLKQKSADQPGVRVGRWLQPVVGPTGRIPLPAPIGKEERVAYVAVDVAAPGKIRTQLQLGSGAAVEAWLNGKAVYRGRPGDIAMPDVATAEVDLREGANHLLFRLTYSSGKEALYARLLDPQRKLSSRRPAAMR